MNKHVMKEKMIDSINSICADKGITKKLLSQKYGCDIAQISRILNKKQNVSIDCLISLLECVECEVNLTIKY